MALINRPNHPCANEYCGSTFYEKSYDFVDGEMVPTWACCNCPTTQPRIERKKGTEITPSQRKVIEQIKRMGTEKNYFKQEERGTVWIDVQEEMIGDSGLVCWSGQLVNAEKGDNDIDGIYVHVVIGRRGGLNHARESGFIVGDSEPKTLDGYWRISWK